MSTAKLSLRSPSEANVLPTPTTSPFSATATSRPAAGRPEILPLMCVGATAAAGLRLGEGAVGPGVGGWALAAARRRRAHRAPPPPDERRVRADAVERPAPGAEEA